MTLIDVDDARYITASVTGGWYITCRTCGLSTRVTTAVTLAYWQHRHRCTAEHVAMNTRRAAAGILARLTPDPAAVVLERQARLSERRTA